MPTTYLLDTCILIDLFRGKPETITWLSSHPADSLKLSTITLMELQTGIDLATQRIDQKRDQLKRILSVYEVLDYTQTDALHTATIRAQLTKSGQLIGPYDLQLAGTAQARNLTLATHNIKEFNRIKNLPITSPSPS